MTNLSLGLSGCKLEIISDKIIRKHAKDEKYEKRFEKQISKQVEFSNFNLCDFKSPKILNVSKISPIFFDMELNHGKNYDQFFNHCSINQIKKTLDLFFNYINYFYDEKIIYDKNISKFLIIEKLNSLKYNSLFKNDIDKIILNYDHLNMDVIPKSFCHGDFSLTNMLFFEDQIFLIDFLDSYLNSILIDLAKLKQDLYYKWTLKINGSTTRLNEIFDYLWSHLENKYSFIVNSNEFIVLDFINLIRIEPYLNKEQLYVLQEIIERCNIDVLFDCPNGR